jgi:hypothetical protein
LGVLGTRDDLSEFVYEGIDAETRSHMGHLPEGKGLRSRLRERWLEATAEINTELLGGATSDWNGAPVRDSHCRPGTPGPAVTKGLRRP